LNDLIQKQNEKNRIIEELKKENEIERRALQSEVGTLRDKERRLMEQIYFYQRERFSLIILLCPPSLKPEKTDVDLLRLPSEISLIIAPVAPEYAGDEMDSLLERIQVLNGMIYFRSQEVTRLFDMGFYNYEGSIYRALRCLIEHANEWIVTQAEIDKHLNTLKPQELDTLRSQLERLKSNNITLSMYIEELKKINEKLLSDILRIKGRDVGTISI
jgi:hypothetical protein